MRYGPICAVVFSGLRFSGLSPQDVINQTVLSHDTANRRNTADRALRSFGWSRFGHRPRTTAS